MTATLEKKSTKMVATRAVAITAQNNPAFDAEMKAALQKFLANDWGTCSENDKAVNDEDLGSAMGSYAVEHGAEKKLWIKRDDHGDFYVITVLYPSDY